MKCQLIQKNIDRWLDGNLQEPLKREVELHVKVCFFCKKELETTETLQKILRTPSATIEPSSDFDAIFWNKVYERSKKPWFSKLLTNLEWTIPIPNLSQAFATLAIAFLVGSAGGLFSVLNTQASDLSRKLSPPVQTLSGFHEFKGIPSFSVAGAYLTMLEERNLS